MLGLERLNGSYPRIGGYTGIRKSKYEFFLGTNMTKFLTI